MITSSLIVDYYSIMLVMREDTSIFKFPRRKFCVASIKKINQWVLYHSRVKVPVNQVAFRVEK